MSNPRYQTMTDDVRAAEVIEMMKDFYAELDVEVDTARFSETIRYLLAHPDQGQIVLMFDGKELAGFSIIIQHWSNEYGGTILLVDELYVKPAARGKGLGRNFFAMLKRERPWQVRTMILEVARRNTHAQGFYESLGFSEKENNLMTMDLGR
jgi:ribosomal protein S18 acetylase RimI-like enzyme